LAKIHQKVTLTQSVLAKNLFCSKTKFPNFTLLFFLGSVLPHMYSDYSFNGLKQNCCQQSWNLSEEAPHYLLLYNIEKENTELDTKTGYQRTVCILVLHMHTLCQ
jgi:hypothetical protein